MRLNELLEDKVGTDVRIFHRKSVSPNECVVMAGDQLYTVTNEGMFPYETCVHDLLANDWEIKYFEDTRDVPDGLRYP